MDRAFSDFTGVEPARGAGLARGVQVVDHAKQPIFLHDPAAAIRDLEWMAQAVGEKYGADLDDRRSA